MDMTKAIWALAVVAFLTVLAVFSNAPRMPWEGQATGQSLSNCNGGTILSANTVYDATANQTSSGTCLNFGGANITVDCHGYTITGTNASNAYGAYSTYFNSTIKNCIIRWYHHPILFNGATNGTIQNVTATSNHTTGYGIYLNKTNFTTVYNSTAISRNETGIRLLNSFSNVLNSSTFTSDESIGISGYGVEISGNGNVLYNLTCVAYADRCLYITSATNTTISLGSYSSTTGDYALSSADGANTFNGINATGIVTLGDGNTLANSSIYSGQLTVVGNSLIYNNTFNGQGSATVLVYMDSVGNNTFWWNNFTNTTGEYVQDFIGGNFYNSTEGNIWGNVNSSNLTGTVQSTGFPNYKVATSGTSYPYNSSTSAEKMLCSVDCADNAPLFYSPAVINAAPSIFAISVIPSSPNKTVNISCNITVRDAESATTNVSGYWYKNGTNQTGLAFTFNNLANNTARLISNLTAGNFSKGQNWSCQAIAFDGANYSSLNMSTNVTILNSVPGAGYGLSFMNYSTAHSFNASSGTNDSDGASDINATNATASSGSCSYASNSTSGNNFNSTFTCAMTSPGSASVRIGFTDTSGIYYSPTNLTNTYPDHAANLTAPSVTPAAPANTSTLTCNNGTFGDLDGDTENTSARTWKWYRNGTIIAGQTNQTLNLSALSARIGENFSCWENTTNSTWTTSWANASSVNVTVAAGTLNVTYGTGINRIRFTPAHAYQTGVEPVNQTSVMPLFNVSASSAGNYSVSISTSPVITGFTLKCAPYYNKSGILALSATSQSIANFTYPPVQSIWCWADFHNPTAGLSYNISVVSG